MLADAKLVVGVNPMGYPSPRHGNSAAREGDPCWNVRCPALKDGGAIILNGSIADIKGFPAMSVYSATKAAVRSFARTWTNDLRDRRIRVNVLSPGHIDTPIMESLQQGEALTKMKKEFENTVPLGRLGDPDEIAKAVSFLASNEASYVSGAELYVDGGVAQT